MASNPSSTLVTLCQQRGVVSACWNNAGTLTPILIHPSYDVKGLPIAAGTIGTDGVTDVGLTYTDLTGTVLAGVAVTDITLGACPAMVQDIELGCIFDPTDSTSEPIPVRVEFEIDPVTRDVIQHYISLIDGVELMLGATAEFDANCDRFQYVENNFCVFDTDGVRVAAVTRIRAYDNSDTSDGAAVIEPAAEVLLNDADGAEYILAAGEILGSCDIVPPLTTPGCLEDETQTPPTYQSAYQVVQYLNGVPDFANATYVDQSTGAPIIPAATQVFYARACGIPCLTCI